MAEEAPRRHTRHHVVWTGVFTVIAVWGTSIVPAPAQVQVGTHIPVSIATPRDYPGVAAGTGPQTAWFYILSHPGATYVSIHFVDFDLGPGDVLVVQDPQGGQRYELNGKGKMQAGTFWARHIKGDAAALELRVSSTTGGRGFRIDEYAAGYVNLGSGVIEAICGEDDRAHAICYAESHPVEYDTCRSVARLLIGGGTSCTGALVSPDNHLLTNNHCITNPSDALNTDFDFMAEAPKCDMPNCALCYSNDVYSGSVLVQANTGLDYSLVQLTDGDPAALYGHLDLDNRPPVVGEAIYNAQHSGAMAKMMAIFSSDPRDAGGLNRINTVSAPACLTPSGPDEVGYYLDGFAGSSGSPIIAASTHKLIALHHCTGCPNRGLPAYLIYPEIETLITGVPPLGGIAPGSVVVDADSSAAGQGPQLAIDRDPQTQWQSTPGGQTHWLQLDLGQLAAVTGFKVWHASSAGGSASENAQAFRIQSAPSATGPWSTEFEVTPVPAPQTLLQFPRPKALRHVRILINEPAADLVARIAEFEVFAEPTIFDGLPEGSNVAPASTLVQASSQYAPDLGGDKAVDGIMSLASRWVSAFAAPPHTLTLDLGATRIVSGFIFRQPGNVESAGYNANVLSFQSARTLAGPWYTESHIVTSGAVNFEARTFASPKSLRYVRLSIADPGPEHDSIARVPEFEVIASTAAVQAGFAATPAEGSAPLLVHFTDLSIGHPTSWSWSFGDGTGSLAQHPSHIYTGTGEYTVTLHVSGPGGSSHVTRTGLIRSQGPRADFDAVPNSGLVPLTVAFADRTEGEVTAWLWAFGDGGTSDLQNPTHTYQEAGHYTVTLTVDGPGGTDTITKAAFIAVQYARADFDGDNDIDQDDFGQLQKCFSGMGVAQLDPECEAARLDADDDVDGDDLARFQACMSGPGVRPDPACVD